MGENNDNVNITSVCIVMLTNGRLAENADNVLRAADALRATTGEILIINNGAAPLDFNRTISGIPCRTINLNRNKGAGARNLALQHSKCDCLLMLDDDAFVEAPAVHEMIRILNSDAKIGAVTFRVFNQDNEEGCLLPTVFHGCACGFRRTSLEAAGGYPEGYTYYGEEYHVSFQLYKHGYRVAVCDGRFKAHHLRSSRGRNNSRIISLLIQNNIRLWVSAFPWHAVPGTVLDTLKRYLLVARKENALSGFLRGCALLPLAILKGLLWRSELGSAVFRKALLIDELESTCRALRQAGTDTVIILGAGKFPSIVLAVLRSFNIRAAAFNDTNSCWANQNIKEVPVYADTQGNWATRLKALNLPGAAYITGTASTPETVFWRDLLVQSGFTRLNRQENPSPNGIFDLPAERIMAFHPPAMTQTNASTHCSANTCSCNQA